MRDGFEEVVLITGDRDWDDPEMIKGILEGLMLTHNIVRVIHGNCRGADKQGAVAADELGIPLTPYDADWDTHHRAAGPIRNQQMIDEGKPTLGLAFHDNLSKSKGTMDMVRRLRKAGIMLAHCYHGAVSKTPIVEWDPS